MKTNAVINVLVVTTSTEHVTQDVVQVGQEAVVKTVSKMNTDYLKISNYSKTQRDSKRAGNLTK